MLYDFLGKLYKHRSLELKNVRKGSSAHVSVPLVKTKRYCKLDKKNYNHNTIKETITLHDLLSKTSLLVSKVKNYKTDSVYLLSKIF